MGFSDMGSAAFRRRRRPAYARVFAATRATGRSSRTRLADLLIAATAAAHGLDLYTRNPADLVGLDHILTVVRV